MSESDLLRVFCDFNAGNDEDGYWVLRHEGELLNDCIDKLGLGEGSTVLLFQDEDDFEVPGHLRQGLAFGLQGNETWVAFPDWSKVVRFS